MYRSTMSEAVLRRTNLARSQVHFLFFCVVSVGLVCRLSEGNRFFHEVGWGV